MKAVQPCPETRPEFWACEIEEGDVTGCPDWCDTNHVGEYLTSGEQLAHGRRVEYRLSTDVNDGRNGEAAVYIWQQADEEGEHFSITVLDAKDHEVVEGLTAIGAWSMAYALREAALRAHPWIQELDNDMAPAAYKAQKVNGVYSVQTEVRKAVAPKPTLVTSEPAPERIEKAA